MTFFELSNGTLLTLDFDCTEKTKALLIAYLLNLGNPSGCYIYFDGEKNPLYIGKSKQLATRLVFHATVRGIEKKLNWTSIGVILCENPHITETELILRLQPPHNKLSKT